jgi:hypothetical protein
VFYCDYDDVSTEHTDADGWCALPERCAVATLTVGFAENGSVIVNLTEEEKGAHADSFVLLRVVR